MSVHTPVVDGSDTERSTHTFSSISHRTIRVFARKPDENDSKAGNRTKRTRGSGNDFETFYSPSRQQYQQVKRGRIDIHAVVRCGSPRARIQNCQASQRQEKNLATTDSLANVSSDRFPVPPRDEISQSDKDRRNVQAGNGTQLAPSETRKEISVSQRLQQLEQRMLYLTNENKRLREELLKMKESRSHPGKSVSNLDGLLPEADGAEPSKQEQMGQPRNGVSQRFEKAQKEIDMSAASESLARRFAAECQRRAKVEVALKTALQQIQTLEEAAESHVSELKRKEGVVAELVQILSTSQSKLEAEKQHVNFLQELLDQQREDLHKEKQHSKYLEAQIHMMRHKRHNNLVGKIPEEEREKLMEINQKLREQATRLRRSQRERGSELFELSPEKPDHNIASC